MLLVFTEDKTITFFLCLGGEEFTAREAYQKICESRRLDETFQAETPGPNQKRRSVRVQDLSNDAAAQAASPESRREHQGDTRMDGSLPSWGSDLAPLYHSNYRNQAGSQIRTQRGHSEATVAC
jgi:hypothetical protein